MVKRKFEREWVDAYFEKGIDVNNRRLFIGDIDSETADKAIKGLYLMETESPERPVEVFISSFGGEVYEAIAIYDVFNTVKCPIHTFAYGKCMSASPLLLAAGKVGCRWVAPHCVFMHHDWATEVEGKGAQVTSSIKHYEMLGKIWIELFSKHTNQNHRWWSLRAKRAADFYFTADQALEWGVADHFWSEK